MRDALHDPSAEQVKCHAPKPILLDTGEMDFPYPWQPVIMPTANYDDWSASFDCGAGRVYHYVWTLAERKCDRGE